MAPILGMAGYGFCRYMVSWYVYGFVSCKFWNLRIIIGHDVRYERHACSFFWLIFLQAGHDALSPYPLVNTITGIILHTLVLTPYYAWRATHRTHHVLPTSLILDALPSLLFRNPPTPWKGMRLIYPQHARTSSSQMERSPFDKIMSTSLKRHQRIHWSSYSYVNSCEENQKNHVLVLFWSPLCIAAFSCICCTKPRFHFFRFLTWVATQT